MVIFSPHARLKLISQNLLIPFSLYLRLCVVFITAQYFSSSSILVSRFFFLIKFYWVFCLFAWVFFFTFIDSLWISHHAFSSHLPSHLLEFTLCPCNLLCQIKTKFKRKIKIKQNKEAKQKQNRRRALSWRL